MTTRDSHCLAGTEDSYWHGTLNGYVNHKCRCTSARAAWAASVRRRRSQRYALRVRVNGRWYAPTVRESAHGEEGTYSNWGCRCRPCTTAHNTERLSQPSYLNARKS